ncbi:hypothetical protein FIBSPDRAFT_238175 [Athelia psychrophila]|uniref:Uncharacterized protein n=1 Tax=Athelia psychrophila TaxID=1759441 RepID=A0A166S395_9AGAM|nr:hypothetical protein FIBSPDRAFT_238175 [Fibularhizoctonia sp. CBS 109695]
MKLCIRSFVRRRQIRGTIGTRLKACHQPENLILRVEEERVWFSCLVAIMLSVPASSCEINIRRCVSAPSLLVKPRLCPYAQRQGFARMHKDKTLPVRTRTRVHPLSYEFTATLSDTAPPDHYCTKIIG